MKARFLPIFFLALFSGAQSIMALTGINFKTYFLLLLVGLLLPKMVRRKLKFSIRTPNIFLSIVTFFLFLYATLTAFQYPTQRAILFFIEFFLISFFFFIGKQSRWFEQNRYFVFLVIITALQSMALLYDRASVFNNLQNYLLSTLMVAWSSVYLTVRLFFSTGGFRRVVLFVLLLVHVAALLQMQSRTSVIFLILFFIFYPSFHLNKWRYLAYISGLIAAVLFGAFVLHDRISSVLVYDRIERLIFQFDEEPRIQVYLTFFEAIGGRWFTGFGIGQTASAVFNGLYDHPHNFVLHFLSEFGVLGLLFVLVLFGQTIFGSYAVPAHTLSTFHVCVAFVVYMAFNFLKSFSLYDSYLLFLALGFVWSYKNVVKGRGRDGH